MRPRSSLLAFALAGCAVDAPAPDPIVICHNANCAGTDRFHDDTLEGLEESLALVTDGRPMFDGLEMDTFLYFDGTQSRCLFAHDDLAPETAPSLEIAGDMLADHLQKDVASWNGEQFYWKVELKPTVAGTDLFHTAQQLQQHAACSLALVAQVAARSRHRLTVLFDSTTECIHNELKYQLDQPTWAALRDNPNVEILHAGPVVPERKCIPVDLDVRTFYVRRWRDNSVDAFRPAMIWMDARSENTETVRIIQHLQPEYIATSTAPFVRGWLQGSK